LVMDNAIFRIKPKIGILIFQLGDSFVHIMRNYWLSFLFIQSELEPDGSFPSTIIVKPVGNDTCDL
jgi:hypothetical protein